TRVRGQDGRFPLQTTPQVGLSPLELWDQDEDGYWRGTHPGSPITEIAGQAKESTEPAHAERQPTYPPAMTFPQEETDRLRSKLTPMPAAEQYQFLKTNLEHLGQGELGALFDVTLAWQSKDDLNGILTSHGFEPQRTKKAATAQLRSNLETI